MVKPELPPPTWQGCSEEAVACFIAFAQPNEDALRVERKVTLGNLSVLYKQLEKDGRTSARLAELTKLQAKLRQLNSLIERVDWRDVESGVQTQLRRILGFTGIIGLRADGELPVLHFRSSAVGLCHRRYDLGDYELPLSIGLERRADVRMTRTPRGRSSPYWIGEQWFCTGTGERADAISTAYDDARYDDFVALQTATMNHINPEHMSRLAAEYHEIPPDEVWLFKDHSEMPL